MTALIRRSIPMLFILLCIGTITQAQLKVGDNPTSIQKSSILELESNRQGLLLPRLADTAAINLLNPPDGMIIFLNADKSLRLRSNGGWKKIADLSEANANWSLKGNAGTDPATNFIGTTDAKPLVIKTNSAEALRVGATGNVGIGTNNPTAKLEVNGSVKMPSLAVGTDELEVLVINNDGSVYKRTIPENVFESAITQINGLQRTALTIDAEASTAHQSVGITNRAADSTIVINMPIQDGTGTKTYGFLRTEDWNKIQSGLQSITIGSVLATPNAEGASIDVTDINNPVIHLHEASQTTAGIVSAGTQTFGGDKTFADDVNISGNSSVTGNSTVAGNSTVTGNTTLTGTASIGGALTLNTLADNTVSTQVLVNNNGVIERRTVSPAAFDDAIRSINGNKAVDQTIAFKNAGTDLAVVANGTNQIDLNVPDASIANRGVVTTAAQTIGGSKTFQDAMIANTSIKAGGGTAANSTVQIDGSVSMAIRTITNSETLTNTDNTVLVNTTSGAVTVTLPAPGTIAGRIYTIKKIGTGGIDKELTITPSSGTIDGGSTYTIYNDYTYVTLQTDGTNWYIIKK